MLITQELIVEVARSYADTPYHHCGRQKGLGVDCIGLVSGVATELGLTFHDLPAYSRQPDGVTLINEFNKCLIRVPNDQLQCGDVMVFWFTKRNMPTHAGIRTPVGMIHTYTSIGKVVEHAYNETWIKRLHCVYRYPGLGEDRVINRIMPPAPFLAAERRALDGGGCCGD
jgi:cell wall-associated NlpC family hydrolase